MESEANNETSGDFTANEIFPAGIRLGCVSIFLLSAEHVQLMIAFVLGFYILYLEAVLVHEIDKTIFVSVIVSMVVVAFVLYEFVEIDSVQQLEKQLRDLEAAKMEAEEK